mmetsp:Transcript_87885/g.210026  ORF Transcript_87885/g.210026 Transcript_87885/m.210026 type:complete len:227 (+) Transcript_87885:4312-4992(+)
MLASLRAMVASSPKRRRKSPSTCAPASACRCVWRTGRTSTRGPGEVRRCRRSSKGQRPKAWRGAALRTWATLRSSPGPRCPSSRFCSWKTTWRSMGTTCWRCRFWRCTASWARPSRAARCSWQCSAPPSCGSAASRPSAASGQPPRSSEKRWPRTWKASRRPSPPSRRSWSRFGASVRAAKVRRRRTHRGWACWTEPRTSGGWPVPGRSGRCTPTKSGRSSARSVC